MLEIAFAMLILSSFTEFALLCSVKSANSVLQINWSFCTIFVLIGTLVTLQFTFQGESLAALRAAGWFLRALASIFVFVTHIVP